MQDKLLLSDIRQLLFVNRQLAAEFGGAVNRNGCHWLNPCAERIRIGVKKDDKCPR